MADITTEQEQMEVDNEEPDRGQESGEQSGEEGSSSGSEDDFLPPPPLATTRSRRANAGNKMHELMSGTKPAEDAEEYFASSNGKYDFKEPELDDEYASPTSSDEDDDEVDSDFDRDEEESGEEQDEETKLRREACRQRKAHTRKHQYWALARLGGKLVPPNTCDPKTQDERLKEARVTEKFNVESLKRFEELEVERKKRQTKLIQKRPVVGPIVSFISKPGVSIAVHPELKEFPQKKRIYPACAVTGKPAKYTDPLTELPYSDAKAFKVIRRAYKEFLATQELAGANVTSKGDVSA